MNRAGIEITSLVNVENLQKFCVIDFFFFTSGTVDLPASNGKFSVA